MTDFRSRRMVVKGNEAAVRAFADQQGWPLVDGSDPGELSWRADDGVSLEYTVDPLSLTPYVVVSGAEQSAVSEVTRVVADQGPVWTLDELLVDVSASPGPAAVARAGVGAPDEYDARFFACITAAMKDPDTAVREAALYATAYSAYPQYHDHLVEVAQTDPDPDRQEDADLILESFD
ncbi:HEAT repeat domain-containing protein [Kribbella sp. NPDC049584]|uniref:HEAT repeat domain-containing protein n=1 Tax=Kribbella sp. NPDC049584 TaxID=3154833 RepID=UPI0034370521